MARKRYIKPEFFDDLDLAEVSIEARFLFAGMWCWMDRQGVMEYDARIHRKNVFPHDEKVTVAKVQGWLDELVKHGFVIRFSWQGKDLIYCPTLKKHQRLFPDEKARFDVSAELLESFDAGVPHGTVTEQLQDRVEIRGTGEVEVKVEVKERDVFKKGGMGENKLNPEILVEFWNAERGIFPAVERFTETRKSKAKAQIAKYPDIAHWQSALAKLKASKFCLEEWRPTFDDWLSEEKRIRALEGKYDDRKGRTAPPGRGAPAGALQREINADLEMAAIMNEVMNDAG